MKEFLREFEIVVSFFVAGVFGGLVSTKKDTDATIGQKAFTVLSGGLIANYTAPLFTRILPFMAGFEVFLAFVLGYVGLNALDWIWNKIKGTKSKDNE